MSSVAAPPQLRVLPPMPGGKAIWKFNVPVLTFDIAIDDDHDEEQELFPEVDHLGQSVVALPSTPPQCR